MKMNEIKPIENMSIKLNALFIRVVDQHMGNSFEEQNSSDEAVSQQPSNLHKVNTYVISLY